MTERIERLQRGTYLPHICEHVTLALQNLMGFDVAFGRARGTGEPGVYRVVIAYQEEEPARAAFATALRLTLAAMHDEPFDFAADLEQLQRTADLYRLGPSTAAVVKAARAVSPQVVVKVIIESAALMKDVSADEAESRIEVACRAARESGCDFIKTSTGFHPAGGATVEAVRLMKKQSGGLYVKASGGIRSFDDAKRMLDAGADRLGCSASVAIVQGAKGAAGY